MLDQPREDVRVARQLEVVDTWVVGKAEVPAVHPGPDRDRVVRDVLLVDVAVADEELGRVGQELAHGQVGQAEPDERLEARALLGVDVDVREVRLVRELDEADVVVGHGVRPGESGVLEQRWVVLGRVEGVGRLVVEDDLVVAEDVGIRGGDERRRVRQEHVRAADRVLGRRREQQVDEVHAHEHQRVAEALARGSCRRAA